MLLEPGHRRHPLIVEAIGFNTRLVHQAGHRPCGQGRLHKLPCVMGGTRPGHKGIARAHRTAVDDQPARAAAAQPRQRLLHAVKVQQTGGHHQKLSSTAGTLATIWDFTSASGGTFSRRSVCPTTWLNTGAATAPP